MIETHLIAIVRTKPIARDLNGQAACRFKVALPNGEVQGEPELYCEAFGQDAINLAKFLKIADGIYILGNIEMRAYRNKDGQLLAPLVVRVADYSYLRVKPSSTRIWVSAKGNLGSKPVKQMTNKGLVCEFDVGIHDYGRVQDKQITTWISVKTWKDKAEDCYNNLTKGSKVEVRGSHISSKIWRNENDEDRVDLRLTARHVEFLDRRGGQMAA